MLSPTMGARRLPSPLLLAALAVLVVAMLWITLHHRWTAAGHALLVLGVLVPWLFATWSFRRMIPRAVALDEIPPASACRRLVAQVEELRALGFEPVAGPLHYNSRPPAQMVLLLHPTEPVYAAVLRFRVFGLRKVHFSFLSPVEDRTGHVETTGTPELEAVTAPPFVRMQVLPGLSAAEQFELHREAIARMHAEGGNFVAPTQHELTREAIFTLARTGEYLRRNASRLARGVFAWALMRRTRNPPFGSTP